MDHDTASRSAGPSQTMPDKLGHEAGSVQRPESTTSRSSPLGHSRAMSAGQGLSFSSQHPQQLQSQHSGSNFDHSRSYSHPMAHSGSSVLRSSELLQDSTHRPARIAPNISAVAAGSATPSYHSGLTPGSSSYSFSTSPGFRRGSDSDLYDIKTPESSPSRGFVPDSRLHTPASPDRQDSLPLTPGHPQVDWHVQHVSGTPSPSRGIFRAFEPTNEDRVPAYMRGTKHAAPPSARLQSQLIPPGLTPPSRSSPSNFSTNDRLHQLSQLAAAASTSRSQPAYFHPQTSQALPIGGELQRLRVAQEDAELARLQESERRRPDYLQRAKRPRELWQGDAAEIEVNEKYEAAAVGIQESPVRGRRLTLYDNPPMTPTPQPLSSPVRVFLEQESPQTIKRKRKAESKPRQTARTREKLEIERVLRREKRLESFTREQEPRQSSLAAYQVSGRGRMLLSAEAAKTLLRVKDDEESFQEQTASDPDWPTDQYPWNQSLPRAVPSSTTKENDGRVHWLGRFLDRDSEEETSSDEELEAYRIRFKLQKQAKMSGRPAPESPDARSALYARRDAQEQIEWDTGVPTGHVEFSPSAVSPDARRRVKGELPHRSELSLTQDNTESDPGVINCICGNNTEDDRAMVSCDGCRFWFHQECMGISSEQQLGATWFCDTCATKMQPAPSSSPLRSVSQPNFVVGTPMQHEGRQMWTQVTPFTPSRWLLDSSEALSDTVSNPSRGSLMTPSSTSRNPAKRLFPRPSTPEALEPLGEPFSPSRALTGMAFGGLDTPGPTFMKPSQHLQGGRRSAFEDTPLGQLAAHALRGRSPPLPPRPLTPGALSP
ncbi:hypothetical protein BKA62DRAFT_707364 [Auriculariales sp. MPI-PUGE-AT-0066]|nr:hypothetical protein BKA62DRAFT_707364 [Auriculariales sp. MPI-PUGE-AT-0066]